MLAGDAVSNPAGAMDVCVFCVVQKGQKAKPEQSGQRNRVKVQRKKENENIRHEYRCLSRGVLCVVSKHKKAKCRKLKTNKRVWMKYTQSTNEKKKSRERYECLSLVSVMSFR